MCVFCDIIDHKIPSRTVYEDENVLAILDLSQLTYGHTIVMPKKHVRNFAEADEETIDQVMHVVHKLACQIMKNTGASGVNVITNCGEAAGQSVDHLHFHIIPRYGKDDEFGFIEHPTKQDLDEVLEKVTGK